MPAKKKPQTKKKTTNKRSKKPSRPTLDDVILSLQKSFSRVSDDSSSLDETAARALIVGQVDFSLNLRLEPENDYLALNREGDIDISLSGTIDVDVREESDGEAPDV